MDTTPQQKCGLGEKVAKARLYASLTIEDLAKHTKISEKYLVALEDEDWGSLPAEVFLKGYVRILAKTLQTDQDEWTKLLPHCEEPESELLPPVSETSGKKFSEFFLTKKNLWALLILVLVGAGIFALVLKSKKLRQVENEPAAPASAAAAVEPPPLSISVGEAYAPIVQNSLQTPSSAPTTAYYRVANKDVKLAVSAPTQVWIKVDDQQWLSKSVDSGLYEIVFDHQVSVRITDGQKAKVILSGRTASSDAKTYTISLKPQDAGVEL